jgi:excisionase family DNA binding protein
VIVDMSFLTVKEAANRLRVSQATVYTLCANGRLTHVRLGTGRGTIRIPEEQLDVLVSDCTVANKAASAADLRHIRPRQRASP